MSNVANNAVTNNFGLFNREVMLRHLTEEHKKIARNIRNKFISNPEDSAIFLSDSRKKQLSERDTERNFVEAVLSELGFKFISSRKDKNGKFPDFWLFKSLPESDSPDFLQRSNIGILEAKKYSCDLDKGDGRTDTPPQQLQNYILENTKLNQNKRWGILSNGYKWRLYCDLGIDKYIEFDFEHAVLGNDEELELMVLAFHYKSFLIDEYGQTILSRLRDESLNCWKAITEELEERGSDIVLDLINGFHHESFEIHEAKKKSYDLLYKLLVVLYVESKNIIPITQSPYSKISMRNLLYQLNKVDWDEYRISQRISAIFKLFRDGDDFLPEGFGGEHFQENCNIKIKNSYIRSALEKLTIYSIEDSDYKFLDFSSLNVELLGDIYENTLKVSYQKVGTKVVKRGKSKKTGTEAHSSGTTYTPSNVVGYLVSEALCHFSNEQLPKVCDPACGSGHFLVEVLRQLAEKYPFVSTESESFIDHKRKIASSHIFGNDKNDLAASLARLMLSIETMKKGEPALSFIENIRSFDSLLFSSKKIHKWSSNFPNLGESFKGFDLVVGNPPYVKANEPGELEYRAKIEASGFYNWLEKKWDLYIPFVELASNLTKDVKGKIAFVVESSVTYAPFAECTRKNLHETNGIRFVSHFSKAFDGWAFPATCFLFDWSNNEEAQRRVHIGNQVESFSCEQSKNPFLTKEKETIGALQESWNGLTIEDICYVSKGLVLNMHERYTIRGEECKFDFFEMNDLISETSEPSENFPLRFFDTEDLGCFELSSDKIKHIEYGAGMRCPEYVSRPTFPQLHSGPRILITSSKKTRSAVYFDDDGIASQNIRIVKRWVDLKGINEKSILKKLATIKARIGFEGTDKEFRDFLEETSAKVSYPILMGFLNSSYYLATANADRRAKHNVSPDVISQFVLPLHSSLEIEPQRSEKFDLSFATRIKKKKENGQLTVPFLLGLIEALSVRISECDVEKQKVLHLNQLDMLVSQIYSIVLPGEAIAI